MRTNATRKAWRLKNRWECEQYRSTRLSISSSKLAYALSRGIMLSEFFKTRSRSEGFKGLSAMTASHSQSACSLCAASHFINKCPQFVKKTPNQRLEIIKPDQTRRYINCFSYKHAVHACPSRFRVHAARARIKASLDASRLIRHRRLLRQLHLV